METWTNGKSWNGKVTVGSGDIDLTSASQELRVYWRKNCNK
jgi:hypothetical protein